MRSKRNTIGVIVIALLVWGALAFWGPGGGFARSWPIFGSKEVNVEQSFEARNVQNVEIETSSTDVTIVRGGSERIEVRLEGKASPNIADGFGLRAEPKGDTLKIGIDKPDGFHIGFRFENVALTVELPDKQWNVLKAKVSSGNISMENVAGKTIEVQSSSGNVELADGEATTIELRSSSGNIEASGYKAELLKFHASSGNVTLKDGEAKLKGDAGSGNIRLEAAELTRDADLSAGSGNVTVSLDREPKSLAVDYRGGSGSGHIKWDGFQYKEKEEEGRKIKGSFGGGDTMLKVVTGSGDFRLD
ncbi:DUF4097 family beta strand repeat-containing protein [Paenibacillus sp. GYB003]|uniref:DUF4097 family beta strand repeat-containing protein n=1 Tax=Paenibacillus sp. GYB003 TaxID=2994392 RepID=UPI002F964B7F